MAAEPSRFVRHNLNIDDIEGAAPKSLERKQMRDTNKVTDIEKAGNRVPYTRKQPYDSLAYRDVYAQNWRS